MIPRTRWARSCTAGCEKLGRAKWETRTLASPPVSLTAARPSHHDVELVREAGIKDLVYSSVVVSLISSEVMCAAYHAGPYRAPTATWHPNSERTIRPHQHLCMACIGRPLRWSAPAMSCDARHLCKIPVPVIALQRPAKPTPHRADILPRGRISSHSWQAQTDDHLSA